jgi:type I restriction enzyme, S subunit
MNEVIWKPLREIASVVRGVTFSKSEASTKPLEGLRPVLRAGNIQEDLLLEQDLVYVPSQKISKKQILRQGDIVMCTSSGSPDIVGKTAYSNFDWDGSFGAFCAGIRADADVCHSRYLFHYLRSPRFRSWTQKSSGANIKNIRKSELDVVEVPLPSLSEQQRIANILDKADVIRRKRKQMLALSDDLLRTAYAHLVGHMNPDFHKWKPYTIEQLAAAHKGSMRTGPFGSDLRHSEFVDHGVAVLGIDNAVKNHFTWDERRYISEDKYESLQRYQVFPGDIIITIMGTTGRSAVVPNSIPKAITTKHLATITCDRAKVVPDFLSFAIHSDPLVIRQIRRANKGAIMEGLNLGIIKALEINLPPHRLQERFAELLKKVVQMNKDFSEPGNNGEALLGSLSQRAFRGEL